MSLSSRLRDFVSVFSEDRKQKFGNSDSFRIATGEIPELINELIELDDHFLVKGSVGHGSWSEVPRIAILDTDITKSTQNGYYIVLLFDKNLEYVHLSLALGRTQFKEEFGTKDGRENMAKIGFHYANELSTIPEGFNKGIIHLNATKGLSKGYENSSIISKKYKIKELNDLTIIQDIKKLIYSYRELKDLVGDSVLNLEIGYIENESDPVIKEFRNKVSASTFDKDLEFAFKELVEEAANAHPKVRMSLLKSIIRNKKFANLVKKRAKFICEICGKPPFTQRNGKPYAEADHIKQISSLSKGVDHPDNMRCLCAQCHRVITYGDEDAINALNN